MNADAVRLHTPEHIVDDRIHLINGITVAVAVVQLLCLQAVFVDIDIRVKYFVLNIQRFVFLIEANVCQLLIFVCPRVERFFDKLARDELGAFLKILRLFRIKIILQKPPLTVDKPTAAAYKGLVLFDRGAAEGLAAPLI